MPRVFLSHSSTDRAFVENELIPLLRANGVETWYSRDDIRPTQQWEKTIRKKLQECEWFLVVLSPRALGSEWVQAEVHWAVEERKGRVIPVLIEKCNPADLHLKLVRIQHVDYTDSVQKARLALLGTWGITQCRLPTEMLVCPDRIENSLGNVLVRVPSEYLPEGHPPGHILYVSSTCVSNGDYMQFVRAGNPAPVIHALSPGLRTWKGAKCPSSMADHPVVFVLHKYACQFCEWLTRKELSEELIEPDCRYVLPSLEQWQALAADAPLTQEAVVGRQWIDGGAQPTEPVGSGKPNALGLYHLLGNVFEWCCDEEILKVRRADLGGRVKWTRCNRAVGGGWNSTREWLEAKIRKGTHGAIWCPGGWPMKDGGFRIWLARGTVNKKPSTWWSRWRRRATISIGSALSARNRQKTVRKKT